MNDSQWPRFEVFHQDRPEGPHRNIGSVHAPDIEMAMLNARDVFVRRPACYSLWIVPADEILAVTEEEIGAGQLLVEEKVEEGSSSESFLVFQKSSQRRSMTFVTYSGQVEATSPKQALSAALDAFAEGKTFVWWICPEESVLRSQESDLASMFEPAEGKSYRHPREYKVVRAMQAVKGSKREDES